jgi:hypothetical protein
MIKFGEFEEIGKELYPRFAEFENKLRNNIDEELTRCFGECWINDITYNISTTNLIQVYDFEYPEILGIINSLGVLEEVQRAKNTKDKLSLGFWIKIVEKFQRIELRTSVNNDMKIIFPMLENVFPKYFEKIITPYCNKVKEALEMHQIIYDNNNTNNIVFKWLQIRSSMGFDFFQYQDTFDVNHNIVGSIYCYDHYKEQQKDFPRSQFFWTSYELFLLLLKHDLQTIQLLRNDFCHFRFDILKLKETKKLLDKYISILTINTLTRS